MTVVSADAAVLEGYGGPEVLLAGTVEVPDPGPGQVRIAVRYAAVGPTDLEIRAGHLAAVFPSPAGTALGFEAAGTVEAVGPGVVGTAVGDEVAAFLPGLGGYASLVLADHWVPRPDHVDPADAAALPASGEAAVRVLDQLGVRRGETLLLLGGTGSVGTVATQLAVHRGIRVLAAVRAADHARITELGARPVTYGPGLADEVRRAADGPVDAVFDAATGSDLRTAVGLAGDPARVITLSNHDAPALGVRLSGPDPAHADAALAEAMTALSEGRLRLRPTTVLPLHRAAEAHARLEGGERTKFLLQP
ncbi:NADP-dependent oxidoreductase [Nocardioides anomalus]|uniref:NADP-dependent oxidoreductase n=1 Tax=Nocardioides anomalus TaxID=2712223 RepID=A0A6G6W996_9ACTN|nr:NADP-dependent oxidoreductase [Nocardioides anomalus]QIG41675.1 NADP-dependent oxidoreductase [Nocardioides anomalus]